MADVKWIKITTDIFDDEKILLIESLPDPDAIIVIWFKLLCLAGKMNNSGVFMLNDRIPITDKMLATIFRRKEATVQLALQTFEQFGMIEIIDNVITIPKWGKHQSLDQIEQRREYMKNYMRKKREEQRQLIEDNSSKANDKVNGKVNSKANVSGADKNKKREEKNREEVNTLFEHLWSLYPSKKGKGQVSDADKRRLYEVGQEHMERAISRYLDGLEMDTWRKPQNGSTFFHSGYVDYLDENYVPPAQPKSKEANDLDNFYAMTAEWAGGGNG